MTYPPAPWHLQGQALVSLHWINIQDARPFIPEKLEIIPLLPGKSIGGVYLASYQAGSVLEYHELIVVPALVRYQYQIGFWVSHIYVDLEDSMRGGREIWGLPKEIADFKWTDSEVLVTQKDCTLCHFLSKAKWLDLNRGWQPPIQGSSFGRLGSDLLSFKSQFKADFSVITASLKIPQESSFSVLNLGQGFLASRLTNLDLTVDAPKSIGTFSIL